MLRWLKRTAVQVRELLYALPAPPIVRALVDFIARVVRNYGEHDGPHAAAGIAYYALFSLFPLVLGTLAIASLLFTTAEAQARLLTFLQNQVPGLGNSQIVQDNIRGVVQARGLVGAISILSLFWAGRAVFIAIRRISNRAWEVTNQPRFIMVQVTNFAATLGIGALFIAVLAASTAGQALAEKTAVLNRYIPVGVPLGILFSVVPFLFSVVFFTILYRFVPDTKVRRTEAFAGGVVAAAALELLKFGFSIYLGHFANYQQVYGNLSTVIATLFGFYLTAQIFVVGAEVSSEYARSRRSGLLQYQGQWQPVRGGLAPLGHPKRWRVEQREKARLEGR